MEKSSNFQQNSKYFSRKNLEFVYVNDGYANFKHKKKMDLCFLDPKILKYDQNLLNENLISYMKMWYLNFENLVMILPPSISNLDDLAELWNLSLKKKSRCSVEIEKIYFDNELKYIILYHGSKSSITLDQEIDFLFKILTSKDNYEPSTRVEIRKSLVSLGNFTTNSKN